MVSAVALQSASVARPIHSLANNTHPQWWRDAGLRKLNTLLLVVFLSPFMIGFDGSLIGGLLAIPRWLEDIGQPDVNALGVVIASQSFGGLIGFLPASWIMDKIGRRKVVMMGDVLVIIAAIGQSFTKTWPSYLGCRIVLGVGIVVSLCSGPILITELAHPRQRGTVASLFGSFFFLGAITSAWTTFGTLTIASSWSWRIPTLLQMAPAIVQFSLMLIVPESPRWLISKGRREEAREIFATYHANGVADDELVMFEFAEVCDGISREQEVDRFGWTDLVKTAANRKRLFINFCIALFAQWSGNGVVSYYFVPVLLSSGITSHTQQSAINGGLQIFNWIMCIIAATLVDKVGRRKMFLACSCGMLVMMTAVTIASARFAVTGQKGAGVAVIVFLFLFNAAYDMAWSPLATMYTAEIHPFTIRSKAISLNFMLAFTTGLFNQYVNPIALESIGWKYYIVYIAVIVVQIPIVYFVFPETKGLTVEEVAILFDGKESTVVPHVDPAALNDEKATTMTCERV